MPSKSSPSTFCWSSARFALRVEQLADRAPVERAVGLCAGRADGRSLARVQRAEMDAGAVDRARHCAAERVDFLREVTLADAADRRVAAHLPERLEILGEQQRARAEPGGRERRFGAGVAAADHDAIVACRIIHASSLVDGIDSRASATRLASEAPGTRASDCAATGKFGGRRPTCAAMRRLVAVVFMLGVAALGSFHAAAAAPKLQRCRLTASSLPAAFGDCTTLSVPLDPSHPAAGSIDLFVARVAAQSATPRADPLLVITGGPGQSAVDFYLEARGAFEQVRRERDLVLVDQRGTGRSAAGFSCVVPDDLAVDSAGAAELERFVERCMGELQHDPRFYTTSVAIEDLERVRAALGIEQWDVYGVSYGTRVAQHYLRRFPERVRAVVLDGVVPPPLALGPDTAREAQRALDRIFARCAADCRLCRAIPGFACAFRSAARAARRRREPAGRADDARARDDVRRSAAADRGAHARPLAELQQRDGGTAARAAERSLRRQLRPARRPGRHRTAGPAGGPELSDEQLRRLHGGRAVRRARCAVEGLEATYLGTQISMRSDEICAHWPAGVIDSDFKAPAALRQAGAAAVGRGRSDHAARIRAASGRGRAHEQRAVGRPRPGSWPRRRSAACRDCCARSSRDPSPTALDSSCLAIEPPAPFFLTLLGPAP